MRSPEERIKKFCELIGKWLCGHNWHRWQTFEEAPEDITYEFIRLARKWKSETGPTSSITEMAMHPAYQQIIGLGRPAIPCIVRELEQSPDHWFWALRSITRADPVPESDAGNLKKMADAWIHWLRPKCLRCGLTKYGETS